MKKALVTLAIGEEYSKEFENLCRKNWQKYCDKYNYELICIKEPLDTSERAQKRSPAWQKCLVLSQNWSKNYDRIVWVDSDILINPDAPDICDNIPIEKVGATEEYSNPTKSYYNTSLKRCYERWEKQGVNAIANYTPAEFYEKYGLEGKFDEVVQTGVMVFSPNYHKEILENVYYNYEEKGLNYEMRPLSYELLDKNLVHWIDNRFNLLWCYHEILHYPFLQNIKKSFGNKIFNKYNNVKQNCLQTTFINSYFLHFVGRTKDIYLVNTENTGIESLYC